MEKLKVLIADDEPKIRRGLKNSIEWGQLGMEVVGDAEDGEVALRLAQNLRPDILLVDICMPFINGLQLIDRLREILPDCLVVVVTGHDEFAYAQQAIKLKVFDYLLKPIVKNQIYSVMERAKEAFVQKRTRDKYMVWAMKQLKKDMPHLIERFFNEWINGNVTSEEIDEQMEFLGQEINPDSGMLIIRVSEKYGMKEFSSEKDRQLLLLAAQNLIVELLEEWSPNIISRDNKDNIVAITPVKEISAWSSLGCKLEITLSAYLKQAAIIVQKEIKGGKNGVPGTYNELMKEISKEENLTPIVIFARSYIDKHYHKNDLSLQEVADELKISPAYLSRLLRQELGTSFIDYLTQVRIKNAKTLMSDPFLKIYEITEKVGYSSQHYFSTAFKKVVGVAPAEYRKGGRE